MQACMDKRKSNNNNKSGSRTSERDNTKHSMDASDVSELEKDN